MKLQSARVARFGARAARGVSIVLALAFASCSSNETGKLGAVGTGDVSAPAVARIMPGAGADPCANLPGAGASAAGRAPARAPYLQRVTTHDAVVAWTIDASATVLPDGVKQWPFEPLFSVHKQWTAAVSGLAPDTAYCYTVFQDGAPVTAPVTIRSAPPPGTGKPVQFVALGDSGGGGSDQSALLKQINTVPFDLMIHTGDIAYESGTLADFESKFFGVYAPLLAKRPIFPASGNHEYETADAAPFRQVFMLPENGGPGGVERWYSYDWGDIHFVALDTELTGAAQAAWLDADLAANELPWTIVYGHKPPHSSGEHGDDPAFQQWFGPAIEKHHVQLVLSGHDHHYERFKPINGVTYIVTGGGGRGVRPLGAPQSGSAFAEAVIHFTVVTVDGDTLTTHAIDATGREFDTTTIHR
jgi:Calcineurin-like phosphoesterase